MMQMLLGWVGVFFMKIDVTDSVQAELWVLGSKLFRITNIIIELDALLMCDIHFTKPTNVRIT